jgi:hypothetical protein
LLTTCVRPRRRTTTDPALFFNDFSEVRTFMPTLLSVRARTAFDPLKFRRPRPLTLTRPRCSSRSDAPECYDPEGRSRSRSVMGGGTHARPRSSERPIPAASEIEACSASVVDSCRSGHRAADDRRANGPRIILYGDPAAPCHVRARVVPAPAGRVARPTATRTCSTSDRQVDGPGRPGRKRTAATLCAPLPAIRRAVWDTL